jgi:hypothetical protein
MNKKNIKNFIFILQLIFIQNQFSAAIITPLATAATTIFGISYIGEKYYDYKKTALNTNIEYVKQEEANKQVVRVIQAEAEANLMNALSLSIKFSIFCIVFMTIRSLIMPLNKEAYNNTKEINLNETKQQEANIE